ncbi:hypothetical protein KKD72_02440, partial [Patescibacteria group bacterium]|nr:hypothetical protein [Patescibacteria group bacterium]
MKTENQEKIWQDLDELYMDLKEWIQLLEDKARSSPEIIWYKYNTNQIIKLTRKLLKDFTDCLSQIENNAKEKRFFVKFGKNISQE